MAALDQDPFSFDDVLGLEDQYYAEGHALGREDGSRAGRIEGRVFGLEKGFEKFVAMGALHAKAAVWAARLPSTQNQTPHPSPEVATASVQRQGEEEECGKVAATADASGAEGEGNESAESAPPEHCGPTTTTTTTTTTLPLLSANPRLQKHVATLWALAEPASLATQNTEEAVSDFDDRFRRAQAKAKVVEKLIGEGQDVGELSAKERAAAVAAAAAVAGPRRAGVKLAGRERKKGEERNMEDFGARPGQARS